MLTLTLERAHAWDGPEPSGLLEGGGAGNQERSPEENTPWNRGDRDTHGWIPVHPVSGYSETWASPTLMRHGLRDMTVASAMGTLSTNCFILQAKDLKVLSGLSLNSSP